MCVCVCVCVYENHTKNIVNFAQEFGSKKHCLQLYPFQGNQ